MELIKKLRKFGRDLLEAGKLAKDINQDIRVKKEGKNNGKDKTERPPRALQA